MTAEKQRAQAAPEGGVSARRDPRREEASRPVPVSLAGPPSPAQILALQRAVGHDAVVRWMAERSAEGPDDVERIVRSPGRALEPAVREQMQERLAADFSDVRLHTGPAAQRSAAGLGARAYPSGNHVVVGRDGLDDHTLAHGLTHVLRQRRGAVAGQDNGAGLSVSDPSDRFEREAECNASAAMRADSGAVWRTGAPPATGRMERA